MVIKLDCGVLLDNSFLSELLSGDLYSWKRGCCAGSWCVVCGQSYRWASGSGLPSLPSAALGEAKGKKRDDEATGGFGHAFCQSLRLASPVALSNLLLINNKKTA